MHIFSLTASLLFTLLASPALGAPVIHNSNYLAVRSFSPSSQLDDTTQMHRPRRLAKRFFDFAEVGDLDAAEDAARVHPTEEAPPPVEVTRPSGEGGVTRPSGEGGVTRPSEVDVTRPSEVDVTRPSVTRPSEVEVTRPSPPERVESRPSNPARKPVDTEVDHPKSKPLASDKEEDESEVCILVPPTSFVRRWIGRLLRRETSRCAPPKKAPEAHTGDSLHTSNRDSSITHGDSSETSRSDEACPLRRRWFGRLFRRGCEKDVPEKPKTSVLGKMKNWVGNNKLKTLGLVAAAVGVPLLYEKSKNAEALANLNTTSTATANCSYPTGNPSAPSLSASTMTEYQQWIATDASPYITWVVQCSGMLNPTDFATLSSSVSSATNTTGPAEGYVFTGVDFEYIQQDMCALSNDAAQTYFDDYPATYFASVPSASGDDELNNLANASCPPPGATSPSAANCSYPTGNPSAPSLSASTMTEYQQWIATDASPYITWVVQCSGMLNPTDFATLSSSVSTATNTTGPAEGSVFTDVDFEYIQQDLCALSNAAAQTYFDDYPATYFASVPSASGDDELTALASPTCSDATATASSTDGTTKKHKKHDKSSAKSDDTGKDSKKKETS